MSTTKRGIRIVLGMVLAVVSVLGACVTDVFAVSDLTLTGPFDFRDNRSVNPVGFISGDRILVGANSITPSGAGTTVQAVQGATTLGLLFVPFTVSPNLYATSFSFDPLFTGAWTITATDASGSASATTQGIPNPELIPFVNNLQISGALLTPDISWTLPDLTGLGVTRIRVVVWDLDNLLGGSLADQIFVSANLAPTTTSFNVAAGVLGPGKNYSFDVQLDNTVIPTTGPGFLQNRSDTFTGVFSTPEPSTLLLLGVGLAGAASRRKRRRH
jgi:hypothetical protein